MKRQQVIISNFILSINSGYIYVSQNYLMYLVGQLGPEWMGPRSDDSDYQELSLLNKY